MRSTIHYPKTTLGAMITLLKTKKLLAVSEASSPNCNLENEHRETFLRYLREIPSDFLAIAEDAQKREIIKKHLKKFYRGDPKDDEIDLIVERVTNLAQIVKLGRKSIENKTAQANFKAAKFKELKSCSFCGHKFIDISDISLDHIIPLSLGGGERPENWQLTCRLCNQQKREYWGISDISRITSIRAFEHNFFQLSADEVFTQLVKPGNSTRYWIFEREGRRCSGCSATADNEKLYLGIIDDGHILTLDNLTVYCDDCRRKKSKKHYCK